MDIFRRIGDLYPKNQRNRFGNSYEVKGKSILGALPGIRFSWSFPPDVMHLFYENVIPIGIKHYRFYPVSVSDRVRARISVH